MKLEDTAPEQETEDDDMERCAPADGGEADLHKERRSVTKT